MSTRRNCALICAAATLLLSSLDSACGLGVLQGATPGAAQTLLVCTRRDAVGMFMRACRRMTWAAHVRGGSAGREHLLVLCKAEELHIAGEQEQQARDVRVCAHALYQAGHDPGLLQCEISHLTHEIQRPGDPPSCKIVGRVEVMSAGCVCLEEMMSLQIATARLMLSRHGGTIVVSTCG